MAQLGATYVELMTPAIMDGLAEARTELAAGQQNIPIAVARIAIQRQLVQTDWDALPLVEQTIQTSGFKPSEYVLRLVESACSEAYDLMRYSEAFVKQQPLPSADLSVSKLLKDSSTSLLKVARLREDREFEAGEKESFYAVLNYPSLYRSERLFGEQFDTLLQYGQASDGAARLSWRPAVQRWIDQHTFSERGCPAAHHVLAAGQGERQTMLHVFWDQLVDLTYGDS